MNHTTNSTPERIMASLFVGLIATFFVALLDELGAEISAPLWAYFALVSLVAVILLSILERVE